jgi:spore coat protein U-like protein
VKSAKALALAGAVTAAMPAHAIVTCSGGNASLAFGVYEAFNLSPLDSTGSLVVTCARDGGAQNVTISVAIAASQTSGSIAARQLGGPSGGRLNYNLYRDGSYSGVWGQTNGTDTVVQTMAVPNKASASATFNIFGRLFSGQDVTPGFYSDSLLITVTY